MRKSSVWIKPNDNVKGYDQVIVYGFQTPEHNDPVIVKSVKSLLKRLSRKKGKKFAATRTQIIKPLKLSFLKLNGYPTKWIAELSTISDQLVRYHAKVRRHDAIPQIDHINLNELPKNSAIIFTCPYCGLQITRFKRSNKNMNYPTHLHGNRKISMYPIKVTYANITLYIFYKITKVAAAAALTYPVRINDTFPQPHTLKRHYDAIPEYYNNHFEKCLTFNPNRISISTLGYVKPLKEINDYDRLTVITW